jgi:hypothetical protein
MCEISYSGRLFCEEVNSNIDFFYFPSALGCHFTPTEDHLHTRTFVHLQLTTFIDPGSFNLNPDQEFLMNTDPNLVFF